jgi:hypothetical protein
MLYSLLFCLLLAVVTETVTSFLLGVRTGRDLRLVACVNCITNPVAVYVMLWVLLLRSPAVYWTAVAVVEIAVVWAEYRLYQKFLENAKISPLVLSVVCNAVSYGAGVFIQMRGL